MNLLTWLYTLTLRLYPPGFRREYAEEMQAVFSEALQNASPRGHFTPARILLRELTDLPANLLRQFWNSFYSWITLPWPDQTATTSENSIPGTWFSAGLAGLPHLLYALSLYLPLLITLTLRLPNYHGPGLPMFWAIVAVMLLIAQRMGWPGWSASWIGYGLVFLLSQIIILVPSGPLSILAGLAWLSLSGILLIWLARRAWIFALLAILPVSPMWIWLARREILPGSLEEAALYVSASLMLSFAVIAIVRLGRWQTALLLLLAVFLAIGIPDSYNGLQPEIIGLQSQLSPIGWGENGSWLSSYLLLLVFTAPLWLIALAKYWFAQRQNQRQ